MATPSGADVNVVRQTMRRRRRRRAIQRATAEVKPPRAVRIATARRTPTSD